MHKEATGHLTAEQLVFLGILCGAVYWLVRGFLTAKLTPDPWGEEVERELQDPNARVVCRRCLTPQPELGWFCEHCGASTGPYNNYMPYVDVFAQGEVLRAGTSDHLRPSLMIIVGYVLLSLAMYTLLAPLYLFFVFRHLMRQPRHSNEGAAEVQQII